MADPTPITRDDIESGLRSIVGEVEERVETEARRRLPFVIGGGVLLLVIVFLIGRRAGRTKSTVVEIRRI